MSIQAVGNGQTPSTQQVQRALKAGGRHPGVRAAAMGAAAKAVGITLPELRAALASGQTLSSIATSRGVSVATLTAMMGGAASQANPSLSGAQAQHIAQRIVNAFGSGGTGGATQTRAVEGH